MAGELLALIAGLMSRRGQEKQRHLAQDELNKQRQAAMLFQQGKQTSETLQGLPDLYQKARPLPPSLQTTLFGGIRSTLPAAAQSGVYVPGEITGYSEDNGAQDADGNLMARDAQGNVTDQPARDPFNSSLMAPRPARLANINPVLMPEQKDIDPKDALSLLLALGAQGGDSRPALAAGLRNMVPNFSVSPDIVRNLDASPEDAARRAATDKTLAETTKLTKMLPLEYDGLFKDNKIKNEQIIGEGIDNRLKPKTFLETVRHNKENERLNGRAIDAGLFNGNANRGVQLRAQDLQARDQEADRELARQRLEFEKSKPRDDASPAEKQAYTRRKNAFDGIDRLAAERDGDKGPIQYIQKIDLVLESGKDSDGEPLTPEKKAILQKTREMKVQQLKRINEDIKARKRDLSSAPKKTSFLNQPRDPSSGRFILPQPAPQRVIFTQSNNNA